MGNVKKSIAERTRHQRQYDRRVNKSQMQTQESKVDMKKALDASLVITKSSGTEFGKEDTSSRLGNDADVDNANIKPVYDNEPMAKNIRMILFSIHSDDGNPSSVNIKLHCALNLLRFPSAA
ncbi:hypothetical protein Tco_0801080 [Tanacetum coccineum]|uniref:Uncharacterized protein n=1 Tax=Tanacetum coccineum TaxID=301880 RepID=A0ABQ4ZVW7_9ASTR